MIAAVVYAPARPGASPEELDGEHQSEFVASLVIDSEWECYRLPLSLNLAEAKSKLADLRADCVFNLVESLDGTDRLILLAPMLFESMGLPYTGASLESLMLTTNKVLAKSMLRAAGISTPDWRRMDRGALDGTLGLSGDPGTIIVKSLWDHGSSGITGESVHERTTSAQLSALLQMESRDAFAEGFIAGREFNLSLLSGPRGVQVLPPAEIEFSGEWGDRPQIVGYEAKWLPESFESRNTPRRFEFSGNDCSLTAKLSRIALDCWRLFGLRGYARVDFRVDNRGRPWVLEVNANPCLSEDAGFMAAARRAGLSPREVVSRILQDAVSLPVAPCSVHAG